MIVVQPEVYFSKWRLPHICKKSGWRSPPYWISKNDCNCFAFGSIITKFSRNIATLIYSKLETSKTISNHNSRISKNCFHVSSIWPIVTKLFGSIETSTWNIIDDVGNAQLQNLKMSIAAMLDDFRKSVAISSLLDHGDDRSYIKVGLLLLWFITHRWRRKSKVPTIQVVAKWLTFL